MFRVSLNKSIIVGLLGILGFWGCSSSQTVQVPTTPAWYLENKQNTPMFLYGVGEGSNLEDAKLMALNSISSSIIVSVSGEISKKTSISQNSSGTDSYSKQVTSDVKMELSKITFPNPVIEKKEVVQNRFFVLLKVNKLELFETINLALELEDKELQKQYQNSKNLAKLENVYALKQIVSASKSATNKANILSSLDKNFALGAYADRYSNYASELNSAKQNLNISVVTNETSKYFSDALTAFLNANGFKQNQKNPDVKIEIDNKPRFSVASGWSIAKVSTNIKVYSNDKVLNSFTIESIGRSSSNNDNATADAATKFQAEIEKKGIDSILFQ